jgi:hypothetical protein
MHSIFYNIINWILGLMAIFWLLFIGKFFNSFRNEYPDEYKKLGSPGIFSNNTPRTNKNFLVFLFSKNKLFDENKNIYHSVVFMRMWLFLFFILFVIALSV